MEAVTFGWSEQHLMVRQALRQFMEKELKPIVWDLEDGKVLPYDFARKLASTFGLSEMVRGMWARRKEKIASGDAAAASGEVSSFRDPAMSAILVMEMCRYSPGAALAFGASMGLCGQTILSKGTDDQIERYAIPVLTMEKVGCWGLTETEAGSDAFAMKTTARLEGDFYILNGSKTFITNAPYADVFVIYARVKSPTPDNPAREAIHAFILERGLPGLSTGQPFKKMGMHASPTGEIFMSDVRVPRANLLGGREKDPSRDQAVGVLMGERTAMPSMCLGIVERLLDECVRYSKERRQFGRPIAEFQLVQEKIAKLFVTREILEMYVHKMIWMQQNGIKSMKEASAAKLYCGRATVEAALDAVQVFGGAGYIRDAGVEMMVRDAKLFTIGGGTDEIQIGWIARELLKD